jgi:hypothetical protein
MITHPPAWWTPPATPEREETSQPPTMEQEGEVKEIKPNVEINEEEEEEHQRVLKEVQENRQHERAKENIWEKILRQNKAFEEHCNNGSWAPHERPHCLPHRLPHHIVTQVQLLQQLREIQEDPHENNDMTDVEFIIDTMNASREQFPDFYKAYEAHRLKNLQWSIQTMRLHAKEFRLTIEGHKELCKRKQSAMIIKNARPDPIDFISTIQQWISARFKEYETFTNITAASEYALDDETKASLEDPNDWQGAFTEDTFIESIIEKLRPHIPFMVTTHDIDIENGQPWDIDTLQEFIQRLNKANWKPARTFEKYEATPTLSQRFSRKQMRLPNYTKPLIKRIMQHYTGIDKKPNSVSTAWNRKIDQLQKDEQEARRYIQEITSRYPRILEEFIQLLRRMDEETYETGDDVFFIATDTMNDIVKQLQLLIDPIVARRSVMKRMNMFLPSGHVISDEGYHFRPERGPKDTLKSGRDKTHHAQGDWNESAYIGAWIGQSDGTVSFYTRDDALRLNQVRPRGGMLGDLLSPNSTRTEASIKEAEEIQDTIEKQETIGDFKEYTFLDTEHEKYLLTRENYLRIAREITDPMNEAYNPAYVFNSAPKVQRLQYGPQKDTDKDPAEADNFMRTEDASTHVTLMRHIITNGNEGTMTHEINTERRRQIIKILNTNPPPYHEGNYEYIEKIPIHIPDGMDTHTFNMACSYIVQHYKFYTPKQYKYMHDGLNIGDFRTLEWRMLHTKKPDMGPDVEPITKQDLQLGIIIWMERQIHRYFHQWTLEDETAIPEHSFVDDLIKQMRQHDEIYGIARAYEEDTNLEPWTINTLRSMINRVTEEGRLPKKTQENHPAVQQLNTQETNTLQERICQACSVYNPDRGDGEGMWMKDKLPGIFDHRGYTPTNGGWRSHCPYECLRSTRTCPRLPSEIGQEVDRELGQELSTDNGVIYNRRMSCKEIVDLYPAHDPIFVEQKNRFGQENIRYHGYNAVGNNWIKRPWPIHKLVQDILVQEAEADWRMGHCRGSLIKFIEEEGREWELTKRHGQRHPLDTMMMTDHTADDTNENIEEEVIIREYFLMQAHKMHNEYIEQKAIIQDVGTPEQAYNFICTRRPSYEYSATRYILTLEALQHSLDSLTTLQKELARALNIKPPTPPRQAEAIFNIKCSPPKKGFRGEDRRQQVWENGKSLTFRIALDTSNTFGKEHNYAHIHYYNRWYQLKLKPILPQNQHQDNQDYFQHWTKGEEGHIVPATSVEEKRIQIKIASNQLPQYRPRKPTKSIARQKSKTQLPNQSDIIYQYHALMMAQIIDINIDDETRSNKKLTETLSQLQKDKDQHHSSVVGKRRTFEQSKRNTNTGLINPTLTIHTTPTSDPESTRMIPTFDLVLGERRKFEPCPLIKKAAVSRRSEAAILEKKLKTDTDTERTRHRLQRKETLDEVKEDELKDKINELIYSKCKRREKRTYEDCNKHTKIIHAEDRQKLNETIEENITYSNDEKTRQAKKQLKKAGYLALSEEWSEPWNPRQSPTAEEEKQQAQHTQIVHIQQIQLENECKWELEHLRRNFKRKNEGIDEEIELQRQLIREQRDHKTKREDVSAVRARQDQERHSMIDRHHQILQCTQSQTSVESEKICKFKIKNAINAERENLTQKHLTEMERLKERDNDDIQEGLRNKSIKKLKRREVRIQQGHELQQFKNTQGYTAMTTDEQEKTLNEFTSTQKTKKKRQYTEITKNTAWQNTLSNTTRPYASKQEMTKYYEIQRRKKWRFRRNNNLPISQTSQLHEQFDCRTQSSAGRIANFNRSQENSDGRRKRRREGERQEVHEKRQRQDMEHALEEEQHVQVQEMRQALETNTRRHEWIQHRELEKEMITRISINEQDQQVHETYTREQWRAWDNYDERQEEIEREQRRGMLDWPQ